MIVDVFKLKEISDIEFHEIVKDVIIEGINELRIILADDSFIDVWYSLKLENRFSYHWERRHIDNLMYRHDNAPHKKWKHLYPYPKHFHDGSEDRVCESELEGEPEKGLRNFLDFVKKKMDQLS